MAKLSEETLRETRDDLIERVTNQKRMGGVPGEPGLEADPLGGQRAAEEWLSPILRKVEIDAESEPEPASSELRDPLFVDDKQALGTYDWNLRTDEITPHPGSYVPKPEDAARKFIRGLMQLPEWKSKLFLLTSMCKQHFARSAFCTPCERRETAIRKLVATAIVESRQRHRRK